MTKRGLLITRRRLEREQTSTPAGTDAASSTVVEIHEAGEFHWWQCTPMTVPESASAPPAERR